MKTNCPDLNLGYAPYSLCDLGIIIYTFALGFLINEMGIIFLIYLLQLLWRLDELLYVRHQQSAWHLFKPHIMLASIINALNLTCAYIIFKDIIL